MKKTRMTIDILMVMLLPFLMAYSLIGENIHEVLGVCMFALFIAHHVINRKWWPGLFKGKYNAVRILNTAINLLLAIYMILQPVSGILMSKYVLKEVTISGVSGTLRTIHMTLAYWGFVLMKVMFAFFDFGESRIRFLFDYAAIMVFVANVGFYIQSGLRRIQNNSIPIENEKRTLTNK